MAGLQWYPPGGSRGNKANASLLLDLSSLARRRDAWKAGTRLEELEKAVGKLRKTYGPLRGDDSSEAWLMLAAVVRLYIGLNRALSDGGPGLLAQAWDTRFLELSGRQEPDNEGSRRRNNFAQRLPDLASRFLGYGLEGVRIVEPSVFLNLDPIEKEELNQLEQIRSWIQEAGAAQSRTVRRAVSHNLHDAFKGHLLLANEQVRVESRSIRAHCSASTWIYEALSRHWRGGYPVMMCAAKDCNNLFPKGDERTLYCSPACVERARRHREKKSVRTATRTATDAAQC